MSPNPLDFFDVSFFSVFSGFFKVFVYAIPLLLIYIGWKIWLRHLNEDFINNIDWALLEIRVPRDIYKTPLAMEMALGNALSQTGGAGTRLKRYWQGKLILWFSLEIVSIEGEIHFFIRTPRKFKNIIESQIYAQYPQAEIFEVEDYTLPVMASMHQEEWNLWGCRQVLTKPDAYPIKTYVDYGLDRPTTKIEEEAGLIDPITGVLEWMGTMGKGEHVWMQILVRATKKSYDKPGSLTGAAEDWKDKAKRELDKIKKKYEGGDDAIASLGNKLKMTKVEQETINAIERSLDKPAFDVGIRTIYLAKKNSFNPDHISGVIGLLRPFSSNNLNGFKIAGETDVNNPWEDFSGNKVLGMKKKMLEQYVDRDFFYPRGAYTYYTLTSEELATIYHFPGRVSTTPTFKRIESKKSEPPVNLPV